jgi:probable F420-dependent oxidoreductase
MKIDKMLAPSSPKNIAKQAMEDERSGFDCVWTFEAMSDPFLPLAHAAAATEKLEIGTNIAVAFARSPFSMAQIAWDLQRDSGGRFHLGLGTQVRAHIERRFSGQFDHPAARVTDYIRCVRAIWDSFQNGTRPNFEGPYYKFKLMNPFFDPGPIPHPSIPIYLAGVNPRMCRAAGEVADGFHVHPVHSRSYLQDVVRPSISEGAKLVGREIGDISLYAPVFVITGDTQHEVDSMEQAVRQQVSFYGSTPSYAAVLEHHGYDDLSSKLNGLMREGKTKEMAAAIPENLISEIAVVGEPRQIGSLLKERYAGVLDRVSVYPHTMGANVEFRNWSGLVAEVHA